MAIFKALKFTLSDFSFHDLPDLWFGIIFLLIGPAFGIIMNNRRFAIYGVWLAICLFLLMVARRMDVHYSKSESTSETAALLPAATPTPHTYAETTSTPQDTTSRPTTPKKGINGTMSNKSNNDDQSNQSTGATSSPQSQTMNNSPGSYMAGRDIVINQAPPPQPLPIKKLTQSSREVSSPYPEYPYGLENVLQTTVPISR
ncbi:MAG TPA: hypothetical protein VH815_00755, partial [Acidobacteriota bacterium]